MKVAGYARVSTDLQREKETIKTQVEMIEQYCAAQGHTLVEMFCDDGVTGTMHLHDRPGGARLVTGARAGQFQGIVVYKADRIGRDVMVNETVVRDLYEDLGIIFYGISEQIDLATPIGRAMFTIGSAIGRLERENTLQRSMDATLRYARDGVWLGGIVPFGYRVEGNDKDARIVPADEIIPEIGMSEADVMRWIYRMAGDDELSCIAIAQRLNVQGVLTCYARDGRGTVRNKRKQRTRGVWRPARVRNMLIETTYKGLHRWGKRGSKRRPKAVKHGELNGQHPNGQWSNGQHPNGQANGTPTNGTQPHGTQPPGASPEIIERIVPALVDEALWERAQATLRKHRLVRPGAETRQYLLRGLIKCKLCGLTYAGSVYKGRKTEHLTPAQLAGAEVAHGHVLRRYYTCNGKSSTHLVYGQLDCRCPSGSIPGLEIENLVWQDVEAFLRNPGAVLDQLNAKLQNRFADADALTRTLAKLQGDVSAKEDERNSLFRLFRRDTISEADLQRQLAEVATEEKGLRAEIERVQDELDKAANATRSLASAEALLLRLHANLQGELSWATKRKIIEALVVGIEIDWPSHDPLTDGKLNGQKRIPTITVRYSFEEAVHRQENPSREHPGHNGTSQTETPQNVSALAASVSATGAPSVSAVVGLPLAATCTGALAAILGTPSGPVSAHRCKFVST